MPTNTDFEKLRTQYKPDNVRILLVGESPPAQGTFFYDKSLMTGYTKVVFEELSGQAFSSNEEFFLKMKDQGCYLDDLSHIAVDKMTDSERENLLVEECPSFLHRLEEMKPEVIVILLKRINVIVRLGLKLKGVAVPTYTTSFPGNGHQKKYQAELKQILQKHLV